MAIRKVFASEVVRGHVYSFPYNFGPRAEIGAGESKTVPGTRDGDYIYGITEPFRVTANFGGSLNLVCRTVGEKHPTRFRLSKLTNVLLAELTPEVG